MQAEEVVLNQIVMPVSYTHLHMTGNIILKTGNLSVCLAAK